MTVTPSHARLIAREYIREHDLLPTADSDIMLLSKDLTGDDDADKLFLDEWLVKHPNVRKSVEQKADDQIDPVWERKAFGSAATPQGRASFYKKFGTEFAEQRREAWGASPGTIQSGNEPGTENLDAGTVAKAKQIVADQDSNSPFNPAKRFLTEETRANECGKYIIRFGTKAARDKCEKFQVDIAGRPLRKLG